jgi:hypothetical protein
MPFRDGSNKGTASNFVQIPENVWRRRKHEPYTDSPNSPSPKKARQLKNKVKSMLIIFFYISGIVHKEFVLAGQTIYCDCDVLRLLPESVWRVHSELRRQNNWLLHHDDTRSHTSFFTRDFFFTKNNMTVDSHQPY